MFFTYIVYSDLVDQYYTGHTSYTPQSRLRKHNQGSTPSTKPGISWILKFYKSFESKTEAIKFEKFIKRQKSRAFIERLINSEENEYRE